MRNRFPFFVLALFFITVGLASCSNRQCSILKQGKFKYLDAEDKTAYLEIKDNKQVEYYQSGKYYIKSDIEWVSACVYELTLTEKTLPDITFKEGDKLTMEVEKIKNDTIYYTGT